MKLKYDKSQTWYGNSYKFSKTSGKTTLTVEVHGFSSSSKISIFNPFLVVTLDTTTYNWPCVNTSRGRYNPTFDNDCPWLLFIVIEKHNDIGNCLLENLNGNPESEGTKSILGINTFCPIPLPVMTVAVMMFFPRWLTCSRVPLHNPLAWSMFLSNMIGTPVFRINLWFGIPEHLMSFKNYIVHQSPWIS